MCLSARSDSTTTKMNNSKQNWLSIKFNFEALLLLTLLLFDSHAASKTGNAAPPPVNVTAVTGVSVDLKCKVRLQECGNFFSIEWYRDKTVAFRDDVIDDDSAENKETKNNQMSGRVARNIPDPSEHYLSQRPSKVIDNFLNNSWSYQISEFEKKKKKLRHRRHGGKIF